MRWRQLLLCVPFAMAGHSAGAETITFEADDSVVVVRAYEQFDFTVIEFIGEAGAIYQCVILDSAGEPIATATAMSDMGQIMVQGVEASEVADVACREVM